MAELTQEQIAAMVADAKHVADMSWHQHQAWQQMSIDERDAIVCVASHVRTLAAEIKRLRVEWQERGAALIRMNHGLVEARQETDEARAEVERLEQVCEERRNRAKDAERQVETLKRERDEARAEADKQTARAERLMEAIRQDRGL